MLEYQIGGNIVEINIYTKGVIKKSIVVTLTIGNETRYYYNSTGLINELKYMGMDIIEILRLLMQIRKIENKIKFKECSFFWYQNYKLKYRMIEGWVYYGDFKIYR